MSVLARAASSAAANFLSVVGFLSVVETPGTTPKDWGIGGPWG